MSNPINPNLQPKYPQPLTGVGQPSLQNIDPQKLKEGVNNNPVSKMTEETNPALYAGILIPTAGLIYYGMNRFGDACRGEYEKTLLGKIDRFSHKMTGSKVVNNSVTEWIKKASKSTVGWVDRNIINKNQILKAFFHTPARPENKMALNQMGGVRADIGMSAAQLFEQYTKNGQEMDKVRKLLPELADKADDVVLKKYKSLTERPFENLDEIESILNKMGREAGVNLEHGGKIPFSKWFNKKFKNIDSPTYLTDLFPKSKGVKRMFARTVYFDEYANKLRAARGGMSKRVLQVIEGLTNAGSGAAGGGALIASVMGAMFLADAVNRTIKAPKGNGEKRKTFAENLLYDIGFYVTIPIATKAMHAFGGMRYIGMKEKGAGSVENYRIMLKNLNNRVDANKYHAHLQELNTKLSTNQISQESYEKALKGLKNKFKDLDLNTPTISKSDYDKRLKALKRMKQGKTRISKADKPLAKAGKFFTNILHKPLKWFFDKIYMTGNEFTKPFVAKDASGFTRSLKNLQFKLKDFSAYPMRMGLFMFLFAPFFAKFFAKGSHLIFGKPTNSVLDEGKEDKQQPGQVQPANVQTQPVGAQPQSVIKPVQQSLNQAAVHTSAENNLLNIYNETIKTNRQAQVSKNKSSAVEKEYGKTYSYIPKSERGAGVVQSFDTKVNDPKIKTLLSKADAAEKKAKEYTGR